MSLRNFIKKTVFGSKVSAKTIKLESLKLSKPRTSTEIKRAYNEGHIAEITPRQAGL